MSGPTDAKAVCHTIDVVEPGGDQVDLQDAGIVEAVFAQFLHIPPCHFPGRFCQLGDVVQHGDIGRGQRSVVIVRTNGLYKLVIQADATQKLCVGFRSIETGVVHRDRRSDHLVLGAAQGQIRGEQGAIGRERMIERIGQKAMRTDDALIRLRTL